MARVSSWIGAAVLAIAVTHATHTAAQSIAIPAADYQGWPDLSSNKPHRPATLRATWRFPAVKQDKYAALVLMHGANGIGGAERAISAHFAALGYAVLMVDREDRASNASGASLANATADSFYVLKAVAADPRIDPARIGIAGVSAGGTPVIGATFKSIRETIAGPAIRYAAHLGFYPNCFMARIGSSVEPAPMLMLMAERDASAPARMCTDIADLHRKTGTPSRIEVKTYPGVGHAFLNPDSMPARVDANKADFTRCPVEIVMSGSNNGIFRDGEPVPMARDAVAADRKQCTQSGALMAYDPGTAKTALDDAAAFLHAHMPPN